MPIAPIAGLVTFAPSRDSSSHDREAGIQLPHIRLRSGHADCADCRACDVAPSRDSSSHDREAGIQLPHIRGRPGKSSYPA